MTTSDASVVDLQTAAAILRKAPNTLKAWFRQGCPVVQKGSQNRAWEICLADVVAWREQQAAKAAIGEVASFDRWRIPQAGGSP
jgi:phage terminase Nu1 subunit (DNA packaging protein)